MAESGYGGFALPIEVFLRNNGEPKKIRFQYELFLGVGRQVSYSRVEKVTFQNPSALFVTRLRASGAVSRMVLCASKDYV